MTSAEPPKRSVESAETVPDRGPRGPSGVGPSTGPVGPVVVGPFWSDPERVGRMLTLAACLIGLVRFVRLGRWSLWFDEAVTWSDIHHGLEHGQISNPLGYHAIGAFVELFGGAGPPDELDLRLLPAIVGWLSIPLAFLAFRPLAGPRRAGAAALLLAVSSWHLYWSQMARFYTMSLAVSLIGAALVLQALLRGGIARALAGFALVLVAAGFHPSAVLLLPPLVVAPWLLPLCGSRLVGAGRRVALIALCVSVAVVVLGFGWAHETIYNYALQKAVDQDLATRLSSAAHFLKTTGFYASPLVLAAAGVGAWSVIRRRETAGTLVLLVVLSTLGAALAASFFVRIAAQYVLVVLPWLLLLACVPFGGEHERERGETGEAVAPTPAFARLRAGWLVVLFFSGLVTCGLYLTVRAGERPHWREAFDHVWNERGEDDLVLAMEATVAEFYLDPRETWLRDTEHVAWLDVWRLRRPRQWARYARRTWYVVNPEQLYGWEPRLAEDFRRFLREECRLAAVWPLYVESRDLSVWVWVR